MKKIKAFLTSFFLISLYKFAIASTNLEDGIKKYNEGKYKEAIELLNKAAKDEPDNPIPHQWLSKAYEAIFDLQKSMQENEIFQKLKSKQLKIKKENNKKELEIKENFEDENNKFKINPIDDEFLEKIISNRNNNKEYKYIEFDEIKNLFSTIPLESDPLARFNKSFEIKVYYGIANHQEALLFYKSKSSLIELEIETLKYEFSIEKDQDKKLILEKKINDYIKEYKECENKLIELINKPTLNNTDPLSFEYYQISNKEPSEYINFLEEKKEVFKIALDNVSKQVNNYKSIIVPQEKELNNLLSKIDKRILSKPIDQLSGYEYELVSKINNLKNKISKDKLNLLFYSIELNVLIDAYIKAEDTIKKIDPLYNKVDNFKLPKKEKIIEFEEK